MNTRSENVVPDRRTLLQQLAVRCESASNSRRSVSLVLIEIRRLDSIERSLGHSAAWAIQAQLAALVEPEGDPSAGWIDHKRLAVVLPAGRSVGSFIEQLNRQLEQSLHPAHRLPRLPRLQIVCGSAQYPADAPHVELLLDKAESALASALHSGDSWSRAQPCEFSGQAGTNEVYSELERALTQGSLPRQGAIHRRVAENELSLNYQPKVDLRSHRVVGVEALARWRSPYLGAVNPSVFIPLAERSGLIHPLTETVIDTAVSQSRKWPVPNTPFSLALNLSTVSVTQERLPALLERCRLQRTDAIGLVLEITESIAMNHVGESVELLQEARSQGAAISLDDFGTGYSSLACLQHIPADEVKLDQAFVRHLLDSRTARHIACLVIDLAHALEMRVVAEGVEDWETMDRLTQMGCDQIQGYFAAPPMSARAFKRWLRCYRGMGPAGPILQSPSVMDGTIATTLM